MKYKVDRTRLNKLMMELDDLKDDVTLNTPTVFQQSAKDEIDKVIALVIDQMNVVAGHSNVKRS